ncbi:hypothetical protein J3Q64DRAFT_1684170 [Phycomyces blakesleeanus]|uniref:Perilipin n=2 Tax=Phycomyces blakesleeanus TaxID=4837 RepID=A0A162NBD4_PHYB8|nr:hypothetical protein PHYBLDRAFT_79505 [Phycomyces blakesleeanus NRRL 1555(-)]OAD67574.1 hypothetical protein PHYBLDRAFT_79505 [Phycomyces blakesleeanus NRRL 1555(-)]|eukprot:XP_018285614.1 hypothetical protein PHYBLDRAFT_79505 [Phycomyces blakesleeanus NRRL 1555(-)]
MAKNQHQHNDSTEDANIGHIKHTESNGFENESEKTQERVEEEPQQIEIIETSLPVYEKTEHTEKVCVQKKVVEKSQEPSTRFVTRVGAIPIVHDSVSTVQALANKTFLGRFALTTATSTLDTVSKYTSSQPRYVQSYYETYVQPHLERADQLGCRSLDLIQTKFPVVVKPTADIAQAVAGPSLRAMDGVKDKLDSTLTSTFVSIAQPAQQAAKIANQRLTSVVDTVEFTLNHYLPTDPATSSQTRALEMDDNQAVRAYNVLNQATLRLSQHVSEQVRSTTAQLPRSRDEFARLAETSALVQSTTANIQLLNQTVRHSVTVYSQAAHERLPPAVAAKLIVLQSTTTERIQTLTQQVSLQLTQVVGFVKTQSHETPEWVRARMGSLVDIASQQLDTVRLELKRSDISSFEKAKHVAQGLQDQVLPVLQTIQSQLTRYKDQARQRAQDDLRSPLEYLGLHAPQVAQAN